MSELTRKQQLYCQAVRLDVALFHAFIKDPSEKTSRILAKSQKRVDRRERKAGEHNERTLAFQNK